MTTQTMIEKVAQAVAATDLEFPYVPFDWPSEDVREHYTRLAHAALQALREPTEEMMWAGGQIDDLSGRFAVGDAIAANVFTAMIDAILQEKA